MAKGSIASVIELNRSVADVFREMQDVQLVSSFLPLLSELKEIEPLKSYEAVLEDRVGPFKLRADLSIEITIDHDSLKFSVEARGEDRQVRSAIRISAEMSFATNSENRTVLSISGTHEISGKVATLGASVIKGKATKLIHEFENQVRNHFER
jgi:carbon monoxide dehydrogenase subunit G